MAFRFHSATPVFGLPPGWDRQRWHGIGVAAAELAAVCTLAWLAARLVWFVLYGAVDDPGIAARPVAAIDRADRPADAASGLAADLFRDRRAASAAPDVDRLPQTQLNLVLYGARTGRGPSSGSAIVEAGAAGQRSIPAGAEIIDGVVLEAVYETHVVINRRGVREALYLREDARPASPGQDRAALPAPAGNPAPAASPASMDGLRAQIENGRFAGLRVEDDPVPEHLAALGLRAGDIVVAIDGRSLAGAGAADFAAAFPDRSISTLTVRRSGETLTLEASTQ